MTSGTVSSAVRTRATEEVWLIVTTLSTARCVRQPGRWEARPIWRCKVFCPAAYVTLMDLLIEDNLDGRKWSVWNKVSAWRRKRC